MKAILSLQYLPCIEYFTCFIKYPEIYLEVQENYIKQSYRNRCYIKSSQKVEALAVPVQKGSGKTNIREVKIDYSQEWVRNHTRAIQSAYGKSPFFEHYGPYLLEVINSEHQTLFNLNLTLLTLCLKFLQIDTKPLQTDSFIKSYSGSIRDYRNTIHPKNSFSNNDLLNPCTYNQVFGSNFAENLSIIDLLFCEGPNARQILLQSTTK